MAYQGYAQATEAIKRAKRCLIVASENPSPDAIAALAGLFAFLKARDIKVDAYCPYIQTDKLPSYLPEKDQIQPTLTATRDFRISLDVKNAPIQEFVYDVEDDKLNITLTPKQGEWTTKDVKLHQGEDRYDLIIAVGCPDRQTLSAALANHGDFAYRTPTINLDHDPKNEHWGSINLVDMTAGASTEVLFNWLMEWNEHSIDNKIATALLAGMIANTQSFKAPTVTPQVLERAAKLMRMGADREQIVHQLWRTRNVSTLKLWGRALSRLEQDHAREMVWTTLTKIDIVETGTTEARLDELVQELIAYAPNAKIVMIFVEHDEGTTRTAVFAQPPYDAARLGRPLGLDGTRAKATGALAKPLLEAKDHAVQTLRETI